MVPSEARGRGAYSFVNFVIEPWDSPWLTHQPLMARMARKFNQRILFSLKEFTKDEVVSDFFKCGLPKSGFTEIEPNIFEMRPSKLYPSFYSGEWLNRKMVSLRAAEIRRFLDRQNWQGRIAYIWNPLFADYLGNLGETLSVFHCHDNYADFYPAGSQERKQMEERFDRLLQKADLVFPCSQALYDVILPKRKEGVHLVENAVDFENAQKHLRNVSDLPEEMKKMPKPIIGYIGRINKKVDIPAMISMAKRKPQWSFLLMGPLTGWSDQHQKTFEEFRALPNAHYIEGKQASELPRYMKALDVGIMNYVKEGTWVSYGFPLKMFEYFSVGKPAVGTDLPSIRKYADIVDIVPDGADWLPYVEKALASDNQEKAKKRMDLAVQNSWDERCKFILDRIGEKISVSSAGAAI